jgi:hypothetical protein
MRGIIIHWDQSGDGIISDSTGRRLPFTRDEWRAVEAPAIGREVDFDLTEDRPAAIYMLPPPQALPSNEVRSEADRQAETYGIISLVCAGIALLFGPLGIVAAIPAIIFGNKAKAAGGGLASRTGYSLGTVGVILGWIMAVLSIAMVLFFIIFFGIVIANAPRS